MTSKRHLALIGLMGAGKTTVGERCAERLQRPFVDTDLLIEAMTGRTIPELFANGEEEFRTWEREAVADACASPQPVVIAEGGGVVVDPENRRKVRATCYVVWLQATPAELASRVEGDRVNRPLLATYGPTPTLARLAEARAFHYEAAADAAVDTDGLTVDQVADAVLEVYER